MREESCAGVAERLRDCKRRAQPGSDGRDRHHGPPDEADEAGPEPDLEVAVVRIAEVVDLDGPRRRLEVLESGTDDEALPAAHLELSLVLVE